MLRECYGDAEHRPNSNPMLGYSAMIRKPAARLVRGICGEVFTGEPTALNAKPTGTHCRMVCAMDFEPGPWPVKHRKSR